MIMRECDGINDEGIIHQASARVGKLTLSDILVQLPALLPGAPLKNASETSHKSEGSQTSGRVIYDGVIGNVGHVRGVPVPSVDGIGRTVCLVHLLVDTVPDPQHVPVIVVDGLEANERRQLYGGLRLQQHPRAARCLTHARRCVLPQVCPV